MLNIAVFVAQNFLDLNLTGVLGLRCVLSDYFRPYQFLTHLFVHVNLSHLLSNMVALLMLGPMLEYTLNARRFIIFYIITGLGASVLYASIQYLEMHNLAQLCRDYWNQPNPEHFVSYLKRFPPHIYSGLYSFITAFFEHPERVAYITESKEIVRQLYTLKVNMPTVGASGSIFGIFMAFAMLFPNVRLFLFFIPIPIKAKYVIAIYGIYELYAGVSDNPTDNVAHFAHLGGVLFAYLFIKWWKKRQEYA
ncbi:MAG: rhomboid family intramembrane serine protease [Bacteroidota bacterium]